MKNKIWIVMLCISILLIAFFLPVNGAQISSYKIYKNKFNGYLQPHKLTLPGLMSVDEPVSKIEALKCVVDQYSQIITNTMDEGVIDLINQINESMILAYLQNLTSFGPRVTGQPACEQAAEYLYNEFSNMGLEVRYDNWVSGPYDSNNVEATLPGVNQSSDDI